MYSIMNPTDGCMMFIGFLKIKPSKGFRKHRHAIAAYFVPDVHHIVTLKNTLIEQ